MKFAPLAAALAVLVAPAAGVQVVRANSNARAPGTIKTVVTALQTMLDDSKKEGDTETDLYTKFKSYCDDNEKEKTESVESLTKQIGLLENEIQDVQANNGGLSMDVAGLKKDMATNEEARNMAEGMRKKEKEAFDADEADLVAAIDQMKQAVNLLADIGADQSLAASAAHSKFMAGYSPGGAAMLKLQSSVSKALVAATAFLSPQQRQTLDCFLQTKGPLNGVYVAQSGGVVGILKNMRETFKSNLEQARSTETAAVEAHGKFMQTKTEEFDTMKASFDKKQTTMGGNDGDLATKKTQLGDAIQQKADDEEFLSKLQEMCTGKLEDYEKRSVLRAEEQAAIAKAIAILNSDQAAGAFDKVAATGTGAKSFVQLARSSSSSARWEARRYLQKLGLAHKSVRLARIAGLLALGNPFTQVFDSIKEMKVTIEMEAKQDLEQKTWCVDERTESIHGIEAKYAQSTELKTAISTLETTIKDPETGLIKMIGYDETSLEVNSKAQSDETDARRAEHQDYQENVANCVEADSILRKAIHALEEYYKKEADAFDEALGFIQQDPAPPETWTGDFKGQKEGGHNVVGMLESILADTGREEDAAHSSEQASQVAYEDSMETLKKEEADTREGLAKKKKQLAEAKLELMEKREDLDKTEEETIAIFRFLERIRPGCDFIKANFDTRQANRKTETKALDKAVTLLQGTPAYASAKAKDEELKQGTCAETCKADAAHVDCKACLAKVSVPGFCAGHPETAGC